MDIRKIRIKDIIIKFKKQLIIMFIFTILLSLISLITIFLTRHIFDNGIYKQGLYFFISLLLLLLSNGIEIYLSDSKNRYNIKLSNKITHYIRIYFFDSIINSDISFHNDNPQKVISAYYQKANNISHLFNTQFFSLVSSLIECTISFFIIFYINLTFGVILTIFAITSLVISFYLIKRSNTIIKEAINLRVNAFSFILEKISHIEIIKENYTEKDELKQIESESSKELEFDKKSRNTSQTISTFYNTNQRLIYSISLAFGGYLLFSNLISLGDFMVLLTVSSKFFNFFMLLPQTISMILPSLNSVKKVNSLLQECTSSPEGNIDHITFDTIELKNVSFMYKSEPVIQDFSYKFEAGNKYIIIGKNGVGKSTLLKLITGLITPLQGSIYYNNIDSDKLTKKCIHNNIAYLSQKSIVLDGSVYDNIKYGKEVTDEIREANVLNTIGIENKDVEIGSAGSKISGGELRKILLSRTLISDKKVIILDEPLNNLDQASTNGLIHLIENVRGNKLVIIVDHSNKLGFLCNKTIVL